VVLETIQPSLISDRFSNGGLYTGEPARIGGFLSSWSQTVFRFGDVDITDPTGSGAPLLFPETAWWERIDVATGLLPIDANAAGLVVTLQPRRATPEWRGEAQGVAAHFGTSDRQASSAAPAVAQLDSWDRVGGRLSGPVVRDRLGLSAAASWTRNSQFDRDEDERFGRTLKSAFAEMTFSATDADELGAGVWVQRTKSPFRYRTAFGQPSASTPDDSALVRAAWNRRSGGTVDWRAFGGFVRRQRSPDFNPPTGALFERLAHGPVANVAWITTGEVRQWSIGARIGTRPAAMPRLSHEPSGGVDLEDSVAEAARAFSGVIGELVDGHPARVWRFSDPGIGSRRRRRTVALHVGDRLKAGGRLELEAGLRFESVTASARGGAGEIGWRSWMPRVHARAVVAERWNTAVRAGYARLTARLPLDVLAVGDPGASTADVFRWDPAAPVDTPGPLVARFGPGTRGNASFSRIDPDLVRPYTDEVVLAIEARPRPALLLALTGVARRERQLLGLVNIGVPDSAYTRFEVNDPGADVGSPADDKIVTVYDRPPATFGLDSYRLTNAGEEATFEGLEITVRYAGSRFELTGGATASIARVFAANRGFGPFENDQGALGELFTNPNAATFARGRPFNDRAYTVKLASVSRFPQDVRLGLLARYQDGQPFARLLIFPNLNQGAEAVRAFPNGDSRFTYTATLDARLQKGFRLGRLRADAVLDAYNLLDLAKEVEEQTTAAPDVRVTTAVQPPRSIHLGLRITF
jgi:hypothetical protein